MQEECYPLSPLLLPKVAHHLLLQELSVCNHHDKKNHEGLNQVYHARMCSFQQQNDSNLNKNDLDLNDHSYEKVVFRRVRILTLKFLPCDSYPAQGKNSG